jgi:Rrf2 family protein
LRYISRKRLSDCAWEPASAREIADQFGLPFDITAKTLQRLKDTGLIQSTQGPRGGYTLKRKLREVSLAEFLELMEGPQAVTACAGPAGELENKDCACGNELKRDLKNVMEDLNRKVKGFLSGISLADLADEPASRGSITAAGDRVAWVAAGEEP